MLKLLLSLFIMIFAISTSYADDRIQFEKLFSDWTHAFNQKNLSASCDLFSKSIRADYQGVPQKNYSTICNSFKKIFQEKDRYSYQYKIHNVYRSDDLAAVRITWYLYKEENGIKKLIDHDEGLDVLTKKDGQWKIINYIGYPVKHSQQQSPVMSGAHRSR